MDTYNKAALPTLDVLDAMRDEKAPREVRGQLLAIRMRSAGEYETRRSTASPQPQAAQHDQMLVDMMDRLRAGAADLESFHREFDVWAGTRGLRLAIPHAPAKAGDSGA